MPLSSGRRRHGLRGVLDLKIAPRVVVLDISDRRQVQQLIEGLSSAVNLEAVTAPAARLLGILRNESDLGVRALEELDAISA